MDNAYIGEVRIFGGNYAPADWALCNGQLLNISSNAVLFSILGNRFGGDGVRNFALPNLTSQIPLGAGAGPGLSPRKLGETGGSATYTLDGSQTPAHKHDFHGTSASPSTTDPNNALLGSNPPRTTARFKNVGSPVPATVTLGPYSVWYAGASKPTANLQPVLTVTYIICLSGTMPPRP